MDTLIEQLENLIADYSSGNLSKEDTINNYRYLIKDYEKQMGTEVPYLQDFKDRFEKLAEKERFLKFIDNALEVEQQRNALLRKSLGI